MEIELVKKYIKALDFSKVIDQYNVRASMSANLNKLIDEGRINEYAELAVGVHDAGGNYSAREHQLGPKFSLLAPPSQFLR
ncbi:hypothetical protein [Undibacterium curvum]|uniref:hypothetical protein n=1 Tax=Undibacterium curvum TaxID=2762294 RepID=UPI003D1407BE